MVAGSTRGANGGDERGLDAPLVALHLAKYVDILRKMGRALEIGPWLTGDIYSLADIAVLPYVYRLDDMAQNWIWENNSDMAPIGDWLDRSRARAGFIGIANFTIRRSSGIWGTRRGVARHSRGFAAISCPMTAVEQRQIWRR